MKAVLLLIAMLMVAFGLTGVFWPEGLIPVAKYSLTGTGIYVAALGRVVIGALLFLCARVTATPNAVRTIGIFLFVAGILTAFITGARAEALRDAWLGQGPDTIRIFACLPLTVGLFLGGVTIFKSSKN